MLQSSSRAQTWDTFFPAIDHVIMGRGTYDKVLTGRGLRLFDHLDQDLHLTSTASDATEDGMVHATYHVHRSPPAG